MVDVAAIFDDVFGPGDQDQGVSKNRCARCVGVPEGHKSLENLDTPGTPSETSGHTSKKGVPAESERCAREVVEKQEVTGKVTKAHRAHRKMNTSTKSVEPPSEAVATTATKLAFEPEMSRPSPGQISPPDPDAFEERSAIIEYDGGLPRQEAETLAAQEQGYDDTGSLHGEIAQRWATELGLLAKLRAVSPDSAKALKSARAFISEGWALQAARLGWDEVELFGVCPRAPWQRLDRKGAAFGGAVQAITQDSMIYVGGLRRYRSIINNDGGAVPIWELAGEAVK